MMHVILYSTRSVSLCSPGTSSLWVSFVCVVVRLPNVRPWNPDTYTHTRVKEASFHQMTCAKTDLL